MRVRNRKVIRSVAWSLLTALVISGCDFESSSEGPGGGTGPLPPVNPGGGPITATLLYGVTPTTVCAGTAVSLEGVNFPQDVSKIRVNFSAGPVRIPGLPIRIEFPSDNNPQNGLESRLTVLCPGGVSPGNVEMIANGVFVNARGYEACPQLMAYALDRNEQGRFLRHLGPLGFEQPSYIKLYGVGLVEIQEVILEDSGGTTARIFPSTIERNPIPPGGIGTQVPTGYTAIGFSLHDNTNNVSLTIATNRRDNIRVRVKTTIGETNSLDIPVVNVNLQATRLGAAINAVKVPTGVNTGPIRIYYSMYDLVSVVNTPYRIDVTWSHNGADWFPALYDSSDPEASGNSGVLPGTIYHATGHRLFPAGGGLRLFTWNAPKDPAFVSLNTPQAGQAKPPREWQIQFRIQPVPESTTVQMSAYEVATPKVLYYYLPSTNGTVDAEAVKMFVEAFATKENEDVRASRGASWGPPNNAGALVGVAPGASPSSDQFGHGTADIMLVKVPEDDLPLGIIDQYFVIDTDQVLIQQVFIDENDPADPDDDLEIVTPFDFDNPGKDDKEFHLRRLFVCPDIRVDVVGANPLVFRLRGLLEPLTPEEEEAERLDPCLQLFPEGTVFGIAPGITFDLNGQAGGASAATGAAPGGAGGPGGGVGGAGGYVTLANMAEVAEARDGEPGENEGGGGGQTLAAVDQEAAGRTTYPGGPGGGGGHRLSGAAGEPGTPAPSRFAPPMPGLGGVARGEARQLLMTGGAGGGGGGAGVSSTDGIAFATEGGGAGGGGGGTFKAVADGGIFIDADSRIECNGGIGGDGGSLVGACGGGGSGGSIVLRASSFVDVECESLQVQGGTKGRALKVQDRVAGSGDGAPGWVRLESGTGGVPFCTAIAAKTTLGANLSQREMDDITVASTAGFPEQGVVLIEGEEISYKRITATTLEVLGREAPVAHTSGVDVVLKGAITPYTVPQVWSEGKIVASPDVYELGRARDGELSLSYQPGIDPETGELAIDPETGMAVAIYTFDTDLGVVTAPGGRGHHTDLGVVTAPNGRVVMEVSSVDTDPGFLDLSRLQIEDRVTLRCSGSRAVRISVAGDADIGGAIDVSGFPGGILIFPNDNPQKPLAGLGGRGGPGGAPGGLGGTIEFVNGDVLDKSPENVIPVNGSPAATLPGISAGYDVTPVPYGGGEPGNVLTPFPTYTRATPGLSLPAQGCGGPGEPPCIPSAGGGGSGGHLQAGAKGTSISLTEDIGGKGGSMLGNDSFRWNGEIWSAGGGGGAGGGASPHNSSAYLSGIPGSYTYKAMARFAPGTGGGGGGGALILVARSLLLRDSARILARGGDAYQSIDLGGNGGAGAGGTVFLQVRSALTLEQGARIDVSGGRANQPVPVNPVKKVPPYEGNVRQSGATLQAHGGNGGNGSPGRIRIEADRGSLALRGGRNSSITAGELLLDAYETLAVSQDILLGVGPGEVTKTPALTILPPSIKYYEFGQPAGTESVVTWEGARESLDQHGAASTLLQGIRDPDLLRDREFVRFSVRFISNALTGETQSIREIDLPFAWLPAQ